MDSQIYFVKRRIEYCGAIINHHGNRWIDIVLDLKSFFLVIHNFKYNGISINYDFNILIFRYMIVMKLHTCSALFTSLLNLLDWVKGILFAEDHAIKSFAQAFQKQEMYKCNGCSYVSKPIWILTTVAA